MTLDERIKAAAEKLQSLDDINRWYAESQAREAIEAAFPELFSDPPTGWIAPWTMDKEALDAGYEAVDYCVDVSTDSYGGNTTIDRAAAASNSFIAMRDDWLSRHPTKPTEATKE